jgi:hypothetical protein
MDARATRGSAERDDDEDPHTKIIARSTRSERDDVNRWEMVRYQNMD